MSNREIIEITKSRPVLEGAGVKLNRAFGFNDTASFDPFLLLDDFRGEKTADFISGFPWHPHRGIETITYMLEGTVEHGDSIGNSGVIGPGGVQWMTAGKGIVHQEMPKPDADTGRMGGFQLWANLPAAGKMIAPRYQEYRRDELPVADLGDGAKGVVICGSLAGVSGPVTDVEISPCFFDISLPAGRKLVIPAEEGNTALVYVFEGKGFFDEKSNSYSWEIKKDKYTDISHNPELENRTLVRFGEGSSISVETKDNPVRFLFMSGRPLREPVAWGGPIVMNTKEELRTAFRQLDEGTFLTG